MLKGYKMHETLSVNCRRLRSGSLAIGCLCADGPDFILEFHTVDTVHLRHIKLSYRPTDAH